MNLADILLYPFLLLRKWQWANQRKIDLQVLWPQLVMESHGDIERARVAFMVHAISDPAWVRTYGADLQRVVWELQP